MRGGGQPLDAAPEKKQKRVWGSNRQKGKQEDGSRAESIRKLLDRDMSVKEVIEKLKDKYPTITAWNVYAERSKLKKAQSSDTFTGGKPEEEEEEDTL